MISVTSQSGEVLAFDKKANIASVFMNLAVKFPQSKIIWCNEKYKNFIDFEVIEKLFHHDKMMLSYNPNDENFPGSKIGYIDETLFVKINKDVSYATWQMSSLIGVVHAGLLLAVHNKIKLDKDFDYYLCSIAKVCMPLGLLCYSEPKLLIKNNLTSTTKYSFFLLFKFVKQHYRKRWLFLLCLNLMIYECKLPFFGLLKSLFYKNRNNNNIRLNNLQVSSSIKHDMDLSTIDVIIPTIGRKNQLYDILKDLSKQSYLPKNIIIVEQNPILDSVSELDYLVSEIWPFKIKHTFTHQPGACNARNLALSQVESEWIFFADDDIRVSNFFIAEAFVFLLKFRSKAASFSCLQKNENVTFKEIVQWSTFGSGCSIVKNEIVKNIRFDKGYEFAFGEDSDFGMQIRNQGMDVLYFPTPQILHLKASMGGFRSKPNLEWDKDKIKPKPSPTVMLYKLIHQTVEQRKGYQIVLFFKYYSKQSIKNPIRYIFNFKKEWKQSLYWANKLIAKT